MNYLEQYLQTKPVYTAIKRCINIDRTSNRASLIYRYKMTANKSSFKDYRVSSINYLTTLLT